MTDMTRDEWKKQLLSFDHEELVEAERTLRGKVERYQGEVPPRGDLAFVDYLWKLRECAQQAKKRQDAVADKMMTLHEDGSCTLKGAVHGDPMKLWVDERRKTIAISVGAGVSYFTALEAPRLVLLLKNMAQRIPTEGATHTSKPK